MFALSVSVVLVCLILSVVSDIVMRIKLGARDPSSERFVWGRRSRDEVVRVYEEVFPGSPLPFMSNMVGLFAVSAAVVLVLSMQKSR